MKIGILTQPLHTNYGGILQAYALQTILERMGHTVEVIARQYPIKKLSKEESIMFYMRLLKNKLLGRKIKLLTESEKKLVATETISFIKRHIKCSKNLFSTQELSDYCRKTRFDVIVVGSDQVWRPKYSPRIEDYFLEFTKEWDILRIAYAASFGVDYNEYSKEESRICGKALHNFNAISVRERSGISLCNTLFHLVPMLVLDPTLLLDVNDYNQLLQREKTKDIKGDLFCYFLDIDANKIDIINNCKKELHLTPFTCMPTRPLYRGEIVRHVDECTYPSPSQWIKCFLDAKMVITDSFHGTAFSINFNKPFWVVGNQARGNARLQDLLNLFGLSDRMVMHNEKESIEWDRPIDWKKINDIKDKMKHKSLSFLNNGLLKSE